MAIRDVFKFGRKTFLNPSGWLDFEFIHAQTTAIKDILKNLFSKPVPQREETFEQAMVRLNLTEEAVKMGATNYRLFALVFLLLGSLVFFYSFYLLFSYKGYRAFIAFVFGMCTSGLFLAQAFKYDFWALQMRKRRLGISIIEWRDQLLGGKGKSK